MSLSTRKARPGAAGRLALSPRVTLVRTGHSLQSTATQASAGVAELIDTHALARGPVVALNGDEHLMTPEDRTVFNRIAGRVAKTTEGNDVRKWIAPAVRRYGWAIAVGMAHDRAHHRVEQTGRRRAALRGVRIGESADLSDGAISRSVAK